MPDVDPWYAEMARRYRDEQDRLAEYDSRIAFERSKWGPKRIVPPPGPPPGNCAECYEWRFDLTDLNGMDWWGWFYVCDPRTCEHAHHADDVRLPPLG